MANEFNFTREEPNTFFALVNLKTIPISMESIPGKALLPLIFTERSILPLQSMSSPPRYYFIDIPVILFIFIHSQCCLLFLSSCVLDGEMLVWDPVSERYLPFGTLKSHAGGKHGPIVISKSLYLISSRQGNTTSI